MSFHNNWSIDECIQEGDMWGRLCQERKKMKELFVSYLEKTYLANPSETFLEKVIEGAKEL